MKRILGIIGCIVIAGAVGFGVWVLADSGSPVDRAKNASGSPSDTSHDQEKRAADADAAANALPSITHATRTVAFENGEQATFRIAEPFEVTVAANGLGKARFMTESPDGRIFVPDMVDYELSHEGRLYILDDFNEHTGEFETRHTYLSGLRGPNNVAFYTDENGEQWLYLTLTEHLVRYPYEAGDTAPSGEPEVVYEFPNEQHPEADNVVWHITRTAVFDDDTLYVSIGSGCNVCEESYDHDGRPVILKMTPEGENVEVYAEGLKNAVGMELVDGTLYATENGVDHLGDDAPDDTFHRVTEGEHYGWPYCYERDGEKYMDTSVAWQERSVECGNVPLSFTAFEPHAAPIGVTYFKNAPPLLEHAFLVALQGSWDTSIGTGYEIHRVARDGKNEVFMSGFLDEDGERVGRPTHILQHDERSFFVSEDEHGRIYWVHAGEERG